MEDEERLWTNQNIDAVAMKHFPNIGRDAALGRPILYSNWLSKDYIPVDQEELRDYTKARLKVRSPSTPVSLLRVARTRKQTHNKVRARRGYTLRGRWQVRAPSRRRTELSTSARPTRPVTASTCTGCAANQQPARRELGRSAPVRRLSVTTR